MKFTIQANDLANAMGKVRGCIPGRSTIPILETYLVTAADKLSITATSLDIEATATAACEIEGRGAVAVPSTVYGIVKALGKREIVVETIDENRIRVTGGRSQYDFSTLAPEDFPQMSLIEDAEEFQISADVLTEALAKTRQVVSTEETRFYLCGVHLDIEGADLAFVATDGHRLCRILTGKPEGLGTTYNAIIPTKAAAEISNIIAGHAGGVSVRLSPSAISVSTGAATLTSKLIAGTYPDYRRVIPQYDEANVAVSAGDLVDAVARLGALRDVDVPRVLCKSNGGTLDLTSPRAANEGAESIDADIYSPAEFCVSTSYLAGLASMWNGDARIKLACSKGGGAVLITSDDNPRQTQVVMPMKF